MTLQKLASKLAIKEGKKSQARIGDIRELLKILVDLWIEDVEVQEAIKLAVEKKANRKIKK
jgi:hypothetical protein